MLNVLGGLMAALQLMLALVSPQAVTGRMHSGEWLRFHVVAADDTARMQHVKLCVRDAVQACYREHRTGAAMREEAAALLPLLTEAARAAALREGFTGKVDVALTTLPFDERRLGGTRIPAGEYPALMIRLGEAQGRNWWGLLDPELSLLLACLPQEGEGQPILWDWSLAALWAALWGTPPTAEGM